MFSVDLVGSHPIMFFYWLHQIANDKPNQSLTTERPQCQKDLLSSTRHTPSLWVYWAAVIKAEFSGTKNRRLNATISH